MERRREIFLHSLSGPLSELLDLRRGAEISYELERDRVQDPFRFRGRHLGLRVASLLVDEAGELDREQLARLREWIQPYFSGPGREGDVFLYRHLSKGLQFLSEEAGIWEAIRRFSPPLCHKKAEEIVRETLWPEKVGAVEAKHLRKAVLATWLTWLRQSTGSCFATAPAILIQSTHPLQLFQDLYDLLMTGQLKRVVEGREYAVPLNVQMPEGDLSRRVEFGQIPAGIKIALASVGVSCKQERKLEAQTPARFLRLYLLYHEGLTEEDLAEEEALAKIQMTPLLAKQMAIHYQKPTVRAQKVRDWNKKFKMACSAFRALTECALLRCWEATIASFCDVKHDFSRWNFSIGLGLHLDQGEGIGPFLYGEIDRRLQAVNREIEELDRTYQEGLGALRAIETMMQNSDSSMRMSQLKSEWNVQKLSMDSIFERREALIRKAEGLVPLFSFLIERYAEKFQEYFQEIFDPSVSQQGEFLQDDSPAGFRLVYKEGRRDASQWVNIATGEQYIDSLAAFFSAVERDLEAPLEVETKLIAELTTALIQWMRQPEFLASAIRRSQENGRSSPWSYISGGTLQTLLQAYYQRSAPLTEVKKGIHSEHELLRFLLDHPGKVPLLMHSPTHAFIFDPALLPEDAEAIFAQNQQRIRQCQWDEPMQEHLIHLLSQRLPDAHRALFIHRCRQQFLAQSLPEFRSQLIEALGMAQGTSVVDSFLFEETPLLSLPQAEELLGRVFPMLGYSSRFEPLHGSYFGWRDLYEKVEIELGQMGFSSVDWAEKIVEAFWSCGFGQRPLRFGDTNWSDWLFAFVAHPASGDLELWRVNRNGTRGAPMGDWKPWLSPQNTVPWTLLPNTDQYTNKN